MKLFLNNEVQALVLLSSLLDSWEILMVILSNSTISDKLTLIMMKDSIMNKTNRQNEQVSIGTDFEALVTKRREEAKI